MTVPNINGLLLSNSLYYVIQTTQYFFVIHLYNIVFVGFLYDTTNGINSHPLCGKLREAGCGYCLFNSLLPNTSFPH